MDLRQGLLRWFRQHARDLPWRHDRTPYRVWVSELMLQQTQVKTALPYYQRWMERFPDLRTLAKAPLSDVLKAWEGLGYYRRARFLHEGAKHIQEHLGGHFPNTREKLLELPGIGPYTSAAIASLAFGLPHAVLDGNVERVLLRLTATRESTDSPGLKARLSRWADGFFDPKHPGPFNEAMMELGATVCTPVQPSCTRCPFAAGCLARRQMCAHEIPVPPVKVPAKKISRDFQVAFHGGRVLLAQPEESGRWQGLWTFPLLPSYSESRFHAGKSAPKSRSRPLPSENATPFLVRHSIVQERHESRFHPDFHRGETRSGCRWHSLKRARSLPMPIAHRKAFEHFFPD